MVADLLTALAMLSLASAAIGAVLMHCADVMHERDDE